MWLKKNSPLPCIQVYGFIHSRIVDETPVTCQVVSISLGIEGWKQKTTLPAVPELPFAALPWGVCEEEGVICVYLSTGLCRPDVGLERQTCVSLSSGSYRSESGASVVGFWWGPLSWLPHTVEIDRDRDRETERGHWEKASSLLSSPRRTLIPFMRAPSLWPNHLPIAPSPGNIIWVGVKVSTCKLGRGTHPAWRHTLDMENTQKLIHSPAIYQESTIKEKLYWNPGTSWPEAPTFLPLRGSRVGASSLSCLRFHIPSCSPFHSRTCVHTMLYLFLC